MASHESNVCCTNKQNHQEQDNEYVLRTPQSLKRGFTKEKKSAFMNRIIILSFENTDEECIFPEDFIAKTFESLQSEVFSFLKINYALKFNIELHTVYNHPTGKELANTLHELKVFKTDMQEIFDVRDLKKEFLSQVEIIVQKTKQFQGSKSGLTLLQLEKVDINLSKYQPLKGSSYIPLPRKLEAKQACLNIRNKDEFCFKWAMVVAISNVTNPSVSPSYYNINIKSEIIKSGDHILNFKELCFPLEVRDISIFEKNNPSISINVFGYEKETELIIGPYYKTKKRNTKHINLLYIEDTINGKIVGHYVWIKCLSRLIRKQMTASQGKIMICAACLKYYNKKASEKFFDKHIKNGCQNEEPILEDDKCIIQYQNYVKTIDVPFVIYANSDCVFQNAKTYNLRVTPRIFSYFIKCSYNNNLNKFRCFKGPNSIRLFTESLIKDAKHLYINHSMKVEQKVPLTKKENSEFKKNNSCSICSKFIAKENKVKLHCRLTGKYVGPSHHSCAFSYRIPKKFPVIFHNISDDECLLFIKEFSNIDDDFIDVIPFNNEPLSCFTKNIILEKVRLELRFLNFTKFIPFTLENIVQNMPKIDYKLLKVTYTDEDYKLNSLIRKTIFPYNFFNFLDKLEEECVPDKNHFHNDIFNEECSADDFAHAKNVWKEFGCKSLDEYVTLCLKSNVLILADIFENFRFICKNLYSLDVCHYYQLADFSWDVMLKLTDTKLKLPNDKSIISFFQQGMREAISQCFQMHSLANNRYLSDYNDEVPLQYLVYFHANELYSRLLSELLPEGDFEWDSDVSQFSLDSIATDSEIGYILEVDLEYPQDVQETHKTLPFCPENIISTETNQKKLSLKMKHKYNYIIYYKNLKQCLKHGLKLQKIHRILKFKQTDFLKKYVLLNNTHRTKANNAFESTIFKLMNNGIYEKIMNSIGNKFKMLKHWESEGNRLGARAFINKYEFSSIKILNEDLVTVELNSSPYRQIPIYLEFIISELTKYKMYSFHYDYIMPKYKSNAVLNYIDTDSYIYSIRTYDFYKDIAHDIYQIFNAPTLDILNNNNVLLKTLGMMKDANNGMVIKEYIGLRSKMYALVTEDMKEIYHSKFLQNNICNCIENSLFKLQLYLCYVKQASRLFSKCHAEDVPMDLD